MLRLLADEHISWALIDGLLAREPELDIVRVWDVGLGEAADPEILSWAAECGRIIVTEDHQTMPGFANARVHCGESMSGLILVSDRIPLRQKIEDILIIANCSTDEEFHDRIERVPLRPPTH